MTSIPIQRPLQASRKQTASHQLDFVHVGGRYRIGKLLSTGGSGKPHSDQVHLISLSSLGSVYLGKGIRNEASVTLKIGHGGSSPSKLAHKYNVYAAISGSMGIPEVLWYGKEGLHEVIVLECLGTSLDDLTRVQQSDHRKTFLYTSQMVHLFYV